MLDICCYYGEMPDQMFCPEELYTQMILYNERISSIDGYIGGDFDLYYCEFCNHDHCIYKPCCNLY